ncbi:MAG: cupin domain-containing protein [Deltaproteobacteria bacterium]|nr:cupin domain-containing protein [Deltaproteobacteria bacterium]
MHVSRWEEVEGKAVTDPGAKNVSIRVLMGDNVGAPNFAMRHFSLGPGGSTPYHTHPWEHEVFVLSGTGKALKKGGEEAVSPGSFVYVAPDEEHSFANSGDSHFEFLCIIPAAKFCLR